jgi:hypothetical protein
MNLLQLSVQCGIRGFDCFITYTEADLVKLKSLTLSPSNKNQYCLTCV